MNVNPRDEVKVKFVMKVDQVTHCKDPKMSKAYGWTEDGVYAVVPLSAIKELVSTGAKYQYVGD